MKIYISSSWKNAEQVRLLADALRIHGHSVYDFTDRGCHKTVISPDKYPVLFDPAKHIYADYINKEDWRNAVNENREAISNVDLIVLLLPCGADSHADWALGVGMGKKSVVVGHPGKGERSPVHLWADAILPWPYDVILWIKDQTDK
jgi:hypothetical protein